ncbi:RNA polymerase factor sigma-70 [Chitinibacteraceae bacterium HSL-7]
MNHAPQEWVTDALRQQMIKFAHLQLGDAAAAEDAVQEAIIGALKNAASFAGRAAFKSWVFAILKNKIADQLRQRSRTVNISSLASDADDDADLSELFDATGHWHKDERPKAWADPDASLEQQQFWQVFDTCLEKLPPKQARVFMMREFIEMESAEICDALALSTSNLFVLLHRARLRLRECLENNWFVPEGS